jgi:hypothetical protein
MELASVTGNEVQKTGDSQERLMRTIVCPCAQIAGARLD